MDTTFNETITVKIKYQDLDGAIYEKEFKIKTDMSSNLLLQKIKDQGDSAEATAIKQASQNIVKAFK